MIEEKTKIIPSLPGDITRGAFLTAFIFFVCYFWILSDSLLHADAAGYMDEMAEGEKILHPVHLGYLVAGNLFTSISSSFAQPDFTMNFLSLFWGAWTLFFLYLTAFQVTGKKSVSIIACLILGVNYTFVFNSVFAEIYMMQTGCLMAALFFHFRKKYIFSASFLSLSILTTPLSLLAMPMFVMLDLKVKPIAILFAVVGIPLAITLWQFPGYFESGQYLMGLYQPFIVQRQAMIEFNEISNGYFVLFPALIAGSFIMFRTPNLKTFNIGIALTFSLNFFLGERAYNVPGNLFVLCLVSIAAAAGLALLIGSSDAATNSKNSWLWAAGTASASFIAALLTGISIKVQRGMDDIPPFYFKTGILVAAIWIGFSLLSRMTGNRFVFLRQFSALALVVFLIFFNLKFTLGRTLEDSSLANNKKKAFACSQNECPDCRLAGNGNDVALFLHYRRIANPDLKLNQEWPLNGDILRTGSKEAKKLLTLELEEVIQKKQGIILISDLPEMAGWLLENGYENYGAREWKIYASPGHPPISKGQNVCDNDAP